MVVLCLCIVLLIKATILDGLIGGIMIKTNQLISEVVSLPVEVRTLLVDKLLESLNPSKKEIDELWAKEAERRVEDIKTGKVKTIPGDDVFKEIGGKFNL